jgi:hypothetical protein
VFLHVPMKLCCVIIFRVAVSGLGIEFESKYCLNRSCFNFGNVEWEMFHFSYVYLSHKKGNSDDIIDCLYYILSSVF